jgi:hypothetical protein
MNRGKFNQGNEIGNTFAYILKKKCVFTLATQSRIPLNKMRRKRKRAVVNIQKCGQQTETDKRPRRQSIENGMIEDEVGMCGAVR